MSNPTPDALKSLYFPALNPLDPAEDYDGGIPIRGVENGLQGTVPAWLSMNIGDRVDVFWNNATQAVWSKTIQYESELNRDVTFTLAKDFVLDGDATNVYYKITGKNHPGEESRPRLKLLVKLTRPGEYDDIPGDDGHSDLNFSLDRYEVDQDFLETDVVTMRITPYRNLTRYDRIHARWGSQQVLHLVSPEQAADPLKNPIDITFDYKLIDAAGDGAAVAVAFQVVDRCGNYPDERAPWSALQSVLVDMSGDRLDSPLVLVQGKPTDRVDLDTLGDDDVIVRVYTPTKDFAVNDEVLLTWTGTPAQGPQIIVGPLSMPVEFVPFQLDFIIPNEAVRAIAKGSASVGFVRRREGESDRPSKNASVSVVGDISRLLAPGVVEAPGGTLPVDTPWATVSIPWYVGRNGSDLLNVIWEAKAPGGDPVYYEDPRQVGNVADGEPVLRAVAQSDIQRFDGLSVKVYYVVTNRDNLLLSVRESLPFIMQVGVPMPTFDRPEVEEADADDVLDPDKVPPTGATLVVPFLGTQDKDRVTYRWRGSASGGSTSDYLDMIPATVGKPVKFTVGKAFVTANRNGTVVADYSIQRGGETLGHSRELILRIGVALDKPILREVRDDNMDDPETIDLDKLQDRPLLVIIIPQAPTFQEDDEVWVTYRSNKSDEDLRISGRITAEFGVLQPCIVEVPNDKIIADSSVIVSYELFRANGNPVGKSETATAIVVGEALPPAVLAFTNAPYEVDTGGELGPVNLRLTRDDIPVANATVSLTLPEGFTYSKTEGETRDFTTDAKGEVSITGIKGAEAEGEFELVAVSKGAPSVSAKVVVSVSGPVGAIHMGYSQNTIAISSDGTRVYVEQNSAIAVIDTKTNFVIGSILKPTAENYQKMFITPDGKKLYGGSQGKQIHVFDAAGLKFIKTTNLMTVGYTMSRDGALLCSTNGSTMTVIETISDTVISTFSASGYQDDFLLSYDGAALFHTEKAANGSYINIYKADSMTGGKILSYRFTPPQNARAGWLFLILSSDGKKIYANIALSNHNHFNMILELSAESLQELRKLEVPNHGLISQVSSDQIFLEQHNAVNPITKLAVLKIDSGQIIDHIEVGRQGDTWVGHSICTLDEKRLYASNRYGPLLAVVATGK